MKKIYMTPEADKIAFNYRAQVVAASAGGTGTETVGSNGYGSDTCNTIDQIVDFLFGFAGLSMC